jgi:putative membrane protein
MMWSVAPWWHWLGMVAFWVLLIGTAVWAIGYLFPSGRDRSEAARAVLDERLARGDIDADEYRHLRETLQG